MCNEADGSSTYAQSGCVASIVRVFEIATFDTATDDPTYTSVFAASWTTMEQGIAIISGNLPMLSPLFRGYFNQQSQEPAARAASAGGGENDDDEKNLDPSGGFNPNKISTDARLSGNPNNNNTTSNQIINTAHSRTLQARFTRPPAGGKLRRAPRPCTTTTTTSLAKAPPPAMITKSSSKKQTAAQKTRASTDNTSDTMTTCTTTTITKEDGGGANDHDVGGFGHPGPLSSSSNGIHVERQVTVVISDK